MEERDDAAAIEASLVENIQRLPMDEIDQYYAFLALTKQGKSIDDIAAHFGVTETLVKQRLAIANPYTPILKAYRGDKIKPETIRLLTMATKSQQKDWFKLFTDDQEPPPYNLKSWLFGGEEIPVSNLWDIYADPQKANSEPIKESLQYNKAESLFCKERLKVKSF